MKRALGALLLFYRIDGIVRPSFFGFVRIWNESVTEDWRGLRVDKCLLLGERVTCPIRRLYRQVGRNKRLYFRYKKHQLKTQGSSLNSGRLELPYRNLRNGRSTLNRISTCDRSGT